MAQGTYKYTKAWRERQSNLKELRHLEHEKYKETHQIEIAQHRQQAEDKRIAIAGRERAEICELCGEIPTPHNKSGHLTVFDHNHKTGEFRGWICDRCNRVLGFINDDVVLLRKMINYLERE